jgi:hypothetical protein
LTYSHLRLLTVKELRVNDIVHCGQLAPGICMPWYVIAVGSKLAIVRIGSKRHGTLVEITGVQIRNLDMYLAIDCPYDDDQAPSEIVSNTPQLYQVTMNSGDQESYFRFKEAYPMRSIAKQGGAFLRR